jgi:hypothetical protein
LVVGKIGNTNLGPERQCFVRTGQLGVAVFFAAGRITSLELIRVKGSLSCLDLRKSQKWGQQQAEEQRVAFSEDDTLRAAEVRFRYGGQWANQSQEIIDLAKLR